MKWEQQPSFTGNEIYHLVKDESKILSITLNQFSNSARIECEKEKRVFLIRREGFRKNRTVIRSEYGIKIGELGADEKGSYISVNDEHIYYASGDQGQPAMILYKDSIDQPLISCIMNASGEATSVAFEKDKKGMASTSHPGLLMALCWYMFLPVARENTVEAIPI